MQNSSRLSFLSSCLHDLPAFGRAESLDQTIRVVLCSRLLFEFNRPSWHGKSLLRYHRTVEHSSSFEQLSHLPPSPSGLHKLYASTTLSAEHLAPPSCRPFKTNLKRPEAVGGSRSPTKKKRYERDQTKFPRKLLDIPSSCAPTSWPSTSTNFRKSMEAVRASKKSQNSSFWIPPGSAVRESDPRFSLLRGPVSWRVEVSFQPFFVDWNEAWPVEYTPVNTQFGSIISIIYYI